MEISDRKIQALGHLPGERKAAYQALLDYAMMAKRSLRKLHARYEELAKINQTVPTKRLRTIMDWSSRYGWGERLVSWDIVVAEERAEEWDERSFELREAEWTQGQSIRAKVYEFVMSMEKGDHLAIARFISALKTLSEIQRLATNDPTAIFDLKGEALDLFIEGQLERLANPGKAQISQAIKDYRNTRAHTTKGSLPVEATTETS